MELEYCSITGADDAVDPKELAALAKEFPFVEWAILLLPSRAGTPRFPTVDWIRSFKKECKGCHTAMHLCGEALLRFIKGDEEIAEIMSGFDRIQLNLRFGDVEGKYDTGELLRRVEESPQWEFILQYGKEKQSLLPLFVGVPNHAVLFDESAGRGISPDSWEKPLAGHFCGYAGGINPGNVKKNLDAISKIASEHTTWIDMETGVRSDDKFDLEKVRSVLEISAPYVVKPSLGRPTRQGTVA